MIGRIVLAGVATCLVAGCTPDAPQQQTLETHSLAAAYRQCQTPAVRPVGTGLRGHRYLNITADGGLTIVPPGPERTVPTISSMVTDCVLMALGAPLRLRIDVDMTRADDGEQFAAWGNVRLRYSINENGEVTASLTVAR